MTDLTEEMAKKLQQLAFDVYQSVSQLAAHVLGPPAPDEEVKNWPLFVGRDGCIWCGDPECPLEAENSAILSYPRWEDRDFTLTELHALVADHIAKRRQREREEAET